VTNLQLVHVATGTVVHFLSNTLKACQLLFQSLATVLNRILVQIDQYVEPLDDFLACLRCL
jgi:hypothetical protein